MELLLEGRFEVSKLELSPGDPSKVIPKLIQDELSSRFEAPVKVDGPRDAFEGIGQDCLLFSSPCLFFTVTEPEEAPEIQTNRQLGQFRLGDKQPLEFREFAFQAVRIGTKQVFADGETQN